MKKVYEDEINPFVVFEIDKGEPFPIIVSQMTELGINQAYIKPDGSLSDKPSFCLILRDLSGNCYWTQISLRTIKPMIDAAIKLEDEK